MQWTLFSKLVPVSLEQWKAWAVCSHTDTRILHIHPAAEPRAQNGNVATKNTSLGTSSASFPLGARVVWFLGVMGMHSHTTLYIYSPSSSTCLKLANWLQSCWGGEDIQAESLYKSYFSRKSASDKGWKGSQKITQTIWLPQGRSSSAHISLDRCLSALYQTLNSGLGVCPGDEKTSSLQTTWQAFPRAWHSTSQYLETWEHLRCTQAEQGSVTSNPNIHIFTLCGWVHCHQLRNWRAGVTPHPLQTLSSSSVVILPYTNWTPKHSRKAVHCRVMSPLPLPLLEWLCSNASTGATLATYSGPKSLPHTTRAIPVMAIKDSLKTPHLSAARTVGDVSYSQRKGGLAGLSLGWCWVFSTPKRDHTWGSPELSDGSVIRITVMWEEASNPPFTDYCLPFIFSILLDPEI